MIVILKTTPKECLGFFQEFYPDNYKQILLPTIDTIISVSIIKKINHFQSVQFCLEMTKENDAKIRFQAGYALLQKQVTMNDNELKKLQDDIEGYTKQLQALVTARLTRKERTELQKFYQDKIALLQHREQEIIGNIEVTATIITDEFPRGISVDKKDN
jgi:hypothetical protein